MDAENRNEEAIFKAAIEIDSAIERAAFVKSACGEDAELLRRVEDLLKFHYDDDQFLKSPPAGANITLDTSPLTEGPGTKIGRYKLLQLIGEGGFGVVYMAEQAEPIRRKVALKIIKLGMDTKQVIARFEAERQALALMDHPNIAKVLDAGATDTGRPYFVMELVKGVPITEYCDKNELNTRQRLELFTEVCKAVQHAHQKGIIHRDIKPSNVMITLRDDDSPVPKIIDFGIAKATQARLTEKTLFTGFKQFIGTPEYMSPEQARMGELDVDTRSDIYSLGVLLYELLTGTTPFEAKQLRSAAFDEIVRVIREEEPDKPSTRLSTLGDTLAEIAKRRHAEPAELCKIVRGDLDWVVMKTLEKDRTRRYETASEFAMDIRRHLGNEPVLAGPPSTVYRLRKFARRHRTAVVSGLLVATAIVTGLVVSTRMYFQAEQARRKESTARSKAEEAREKEAVARTEAVAARDKAQEAESIAQQQRQRAQRLLARSQIDRGVRRFNEGNGLGLLYLLDARMTADEIPDLRDQASRLWSIAYDLWSDPLVQVFGDGGGHPLVFSPDGRLLATATRTRARFWDTATGQLHGPALQFERTIDMIAFSPDGELLATHSLEGVSRLWETATGKPAGPALRNNGTLDQSSAREYASVNFRWSAAFSPNGKLLATASVGGAVGLWETETGRPYGQPIQHECEVWTVAFSPDGKLLASGAEDGAVRLWEVASGQPHGSVLQHNNPVRKVTFSPDGTLVATMTRGGAFVQLWETQTGRLHKQLLHEAPGWATEISFSPDGQLLAASQGCMTRLWDTRTGEEGEPLCHEAIVGAMAFSPDGRLLATGARDRTTRLWDVGGRRPYGPLLWHSNGLDSVVFSPDGQYLASRPWGGMTRLSRTFQPLRTEVVQRQVANDLGTVSADGHIGAIILDNAVQLWNTKTFKTMGKPLRHGDYVGAVALSRDGKLIAFCVKYKWRVEIFEVVTGRRLHSFQCWGSPACAGFSPDGKTLAMATDGGVVQQWDMATGRLIGWLRDRGPGQAVAYSPDGKLLATSLDDQAKTVRLWDISIGPPYYSLELPANAISGKEALESFSADGTLLVGRLPEGKARVWRVPDAPTDLREMQLRTWISLGLRRNQEGQITPTEWKEWHELRRELARTIPAREPRLSDAADSRGSSNITLLWTPGSDASAHNVYFGTNPDQLKLLGKVEDARYENLPPLDRGTTYWWRVDTLKSDGSVTKGDLWTFRTGKIVGWWKLDGDVTDCAGSGYDGEIINGGQWVDGRIGGALQFDGEDDFVSLPIGTLLSTLNRATIMLWVNFSNEGGAWQRIFDFGTDQTNYIYVCPRTGVDGPMHTSMTTPEGKFANFDANSGTLASGWHHLAVIIEPDNLQLYLDGEVVGKTSGLYALSDLGVTTNNWLGRWQYPADAFFKGTMDDLRIYDYAMSQAEVTAVYAGEEEQPAEKEAWAIDVSKDEDAPPEFEPEQEDQYYVPLEAEKAPSVPDQLSIEELKILRRVLKGSELSKHDFYIFALADLHVGDIDGYRERCTECLQQFEETDDPGVCHWVAWSCVLAPNAVKDFNRVVELAECAVVKGSKTDQNLTALGAVLYRAGRFEEAVRKLSDLATEWEQGKELPTQTSPAYTWFFLAMAHHQLGNADQSQRYFELAADRAEQEMAGAAGWNRKLTLQLLQSEAQSLLGVSQKISPDEKEVMAEEEK
jgi:WD40 repeat protein/serine/threonine protein kinase